MLSPFFWKWHDTIYCFCDRSLCVVLCECGGCHGICADTRTSVGIVERRHRRTHRSPAKSPGLARRQNRCVFASLVERRSESQWHTRVCGARWSSYWCDHWQQRSPARHRRRCHQQQPHAWRNRSRAVGLATLQRRRQATLAGCQSFVERTRHHQIADARQSIGHRSRCRHSKIHVIGQSSHTTQRQRRTGAAECRQSTGRQPNTRHTVVAQPTLEPRRQRASAPPIRSLVAYHSICLGLGRKIRRFVHRHQLGLYFVVGRFGAGHHLRLDGRDQHGARRVDDDWRLRHLCGARYVSPVFAQRVRCVFADGGARVFLERRIGGRCVRAFGVAPFVWSPA